MGSALHRLLNYLLEQQPLATYACAGVIWVFGLAVAWAWLPGVSVNRLRIAWSLSLTITATFAAVYVLSLIDSGKGIVLIIYALEFPIEFGLAMLFVPCLMINNMIQKSHPLALLVPALTITLVVAHIAKSLTPTE